MNQRILYLKSGRAIPEAQALFPRLGELPTNGPDHFLLAVLHHTRQDELFLVSPGERNRSAQVDGRRVSEFGIQSGIKTPGLRQLHIVWSALNFLIRAISYRPHTIVSGVEGPFGLAGLMAAKVVGARYLFIGHTGLAQPTISSKFRQANRLICQHADRLAAHGPFIRQEMIELGVSSDHIIEFDVGLDPVPQAMIEALPARAPGVDGHVLFLGRVEQEKGVFDLLDAFTERFRGSTHRLKFAGTGGAESALRERAQQLGMAKQVEVLGRVPFADLYKLIKGACVMVTPTRTSFAEGRCVAVMEALYAGTPVIAPAYGPFPYLVKHDRNGLLYEVDNAQALGDALQRFVQEPGLSDRLAAGALEEGERLKRPAITFPDAVKMLLSPSSTHG